MDRNADLFVPAGVEEIERREAGGRGRISARRKEVLLKINKSGLFADGSQRHAFAVRFTDESYKKATASDYVRLGLNADKTKMIFWTGSPEKGFKLSRSSRAGRYKSITFSQGVDENISFWKGVEGNYDLLKDVKTGCYYIDLSKR